MTPRTNRRLSPSVVAVLILLVCSCTGSISEPSAYDPAPDDELAPGNEGAGAGGAGGATPRPEGTSPRPPGAAGGARCATEQTGPSAPRLWRLDDAQYGKTVATLFKGRSRGANDDLTPPAG